MNKQHFEAFAAEARSWRLNAKTHEANGDTAKAEVCYQNALGIEQATINVGKRFNPRFDEARFRAACNPDAKK